MTILLFVSGCNKKQITIGLLTSNHNTISSELVALNHLLQQEQGILCRYIAMDRLDSLHHYDIIWYHRPDSLPVTFEEKNIGQQIKQYVTGGGKLILSMDAVRLLNEWGIEPATVETSAFHAVDKGFGRKAGFHAYREHPLFDQMFGGAYTWHGKEDNQCRVLGFFGDKKPLAPQTRVIGTLWEYIFYHPEYKVLWETVIGEGKILAIGGFLYYDKANFHSKILHRFTQNCLHYMLDKPAQSKSYYWESMPAEVVAKELRLKPVQPSLPSVWVIPSTREAMVRKATDMPIDLPSQRTVVIAKEQSGIEEVWTHPFLSFRDYSVWLDMKGYDTLISLHQIDATVELRANAIIRTYHIGDCLLKEILTSQIDKPVVVIHYEWTGDKIRRILTESKSNLRLMWPYDQYALGSLYYHWSPEINAFVVYDNNKEFAAAIGGNLPGQLLVTGRFDGFNYRNLTTPEGISTDKLQVASAIAYDVTQHRALDIFMVAGNEGVDKMVTDYSAATKEPLQVFNTSAKYYKDYLSNHLMITTPDTIFNEGFRWALLSSIQFLAETPGIGTSLMAGYSSSRKGWGGAHQVSGRPGYAWYFGRDAVWSALAFTGIGDFVTVKKVLETLIKYQQIDGKIYHELTTSGSVHFDASDATPLFVTLMARYLKGSGDIGFIRKNMKAVNKAMEYCYATDTDGDRLIEITNVGHGWLEGGKLYGSDTEFYLAGLWNAALRDAAYLATVTGDTINQNKYSSEAETVYNIINQGFWNDKGYFNYGKYKDGTYTDQCIILTTVPVYMGVTEQDKSLRMVKQFASARYSTDWGVRMIDDTHPVFNPASYHFGSVWPLFTGWTALAEYKVGRYHQGFSHIMANLLNYRSIAFGRVPEVIHGQLYKPSGVTLHQCWSETMVIQPVVEGLLGFVPDALDNRITLAPRVPFHWNTVEVKNLRMKNTSLTFNMVRQKDKTVYSFISDKPLNITFTPTFPLGTTINKVLANGKEVKFALQNAPEYTTLSIDILVTASTVVEIFRQEGMTALPAYRSAQPGDTSQGIRILEQRLVDNMLEVWVEGNSGSQVSLDLYLPQGYKHIEGVKSIFKKENHVYKVDIVLDKSKDKYVQQRLVISG